MNSFLNSFKIVILLYTQTSIKGFKNFILHVGIEKRLGFIIGEQNTIISIKVKLLFYYIHKPQSKN